MDEDQQHLVRIEADLRLVESELQRLLERQESLIAERNIIRSRQTRCEESPSSAATTESTKNLHKNDFPWSSKLISVLKGVFGLDELRPFQLPTINALMSRQDCILIMPTGGGKSLCFQLPALLVEGITLVVSPLVSLMEDQVMALKGRGVEAEMLSGSVSPKDQRAIMKAMVDSWAKIKILYVTPERMKKSKLFMTNLEKMYSMGRLSHLIVDEIHCCSQWGHDFRPDYKVLGILKGQFPTVPILGLTATATTAITLDVQKMLDIEKCLVFRASFNRPNLTYKVITKPSSSKETVAKLSRLVRSKYDGQSGIVYCFSVKESDELARDLRTLGIAARSYHASLAPEERSRVHRDWLANKCQVVVATVAFGMGIDKPDVRFVIHHSISKSVENFYQESGRAGRDGKPADCIVFFRLADIFRVSAMTFQDKTGISNLYSTVAFCIELKRCRRAILADHFGERWESSSCNKMCDNCNVLLADGGIASRTTESIDVTRHCAALLNIIEHAGKVNKPVTGLQLMDSWFGKGAANQRFKGQVPNIPRTECERMFASLLLQDYFKEKFHFTAYSTVSYIVKGSRASQVVAGKTKITMDVVTSSSSKAASQTGRTWSTPAKADTRTNPKVGVNAVSTTAGEHSKSKTRESAVKHKNKMGDFEEAIPGGSYPNSRAPPPVKAAPASNAIRFVVDKIDLTNSSTEMNINDTLAAGIDWDDDIFADDFSSTPAAMDLERLNVLDVTAASGDSEKRNVEVEPPPPPLAIESRKPYDNGKLSKYSFTRIKRDVVDNNDPNLAAKRSKM